MCIITLTMENLNYDQPNNEMSVADNSAENLPNNEGNQLSRRTLLKGFAALAGAAFVSATTAPVVEADTENKSEEVVDLSMEAAPTTESQQFAKCYECA